MHPGCFAATWHLHVQRYWIGSIQSACRLTATGVEVENDGKTKAQTASSCQGIYDAFGGDENLADEDERWLGEPGAGTKKVCYVKDGAAFSLPPVTCANEQAEQDDGRHPISCKEASARCADFSGTGAFWIKPPGTAVMRVVCDMNTKGDDGGSGWMRAYTEDLINFGGKCKCNAGCSFSFECDSFYSYPNSHDYEVWNHFNLLVDWREVKGNMFYAAQCGGVNNGCSTGGAHPDNENRGFNSDPKYEQLGLSGEGGGNKNWLRWGKPGQVLQAFDELGWSGQWTGTKTTTTINAKVRFGARLSSSS